MSLKTYDIEEFMKQLKTFMKNTNEMLASFKLRIDNQQIDIDKINKELKNYKNNGKKILI